MKKVIIGLAIIVVIAVGLFVFGGVGKEFLGQQATPAAKPATADTKVESKITAEGRVVPVKYALLSTNVGGTVVEAPAAEGARVEAGQLILRLDSRQQAAAVAEAEAGLQRAQAQLAEAQAGPRPQDVTTAEAAVEAAQAQLARLWQGPTKNDLIAARADLENATAAVKQAQTAYDRDGGPSNPYSGMLASSLQLEQATNNYNASKARYEALQDGPRAADVAAAQAELKRAQAQLDLVKAGPRPETIAVAQAGVATAQAALARAKLALADTELHAPFAGDVVAIDIKVGEQVAAGVPVVRVADSSAWRIETTDLTELNVVGLREGTSATMTIDALPGVELRGVVSRVKMLGENKQGDIVYTVVITPDQAEQRLRWNMTAQVQVQSQ